MRLAIVLLTLGALTLPFKAQSADTQRYTQTAQQAIAALENATKDDLVKIRAMQDELLQIGIEAARELGAHDEEIGEMMAFVIDSVPAMQAMSLEEIEVQWHDGIALETAGYMNSTHDHFGVINSVMDMILHPVTVQLALTEFENTGNKDYLWQAKEELHEVVMHVNHIQPNKASPPAIPD